MPASPSMKALHNDRLIAKDQTKVQLDTVAFKYAAMVFEGIRAYWNNNEEQLFVFRLGDNAHRLENSVRIVRSGYALHSRLPHILWLAGPPAA